MFEQKSISKYGGRDELDSKVALEIECVWFTPVYLTTEPGGSSQLKFVTVRGVVPVVVQSKESCVCELDVSPVVPKEEEPYGNLLSKELSLVHPDGHELVESTINFPSQLASELPALLLP
mgnify:CR=1 FL=1